MHATSQIVDYRNDNVHSGNTFTPSQILYGGNLPEVVLLSFMAIEVDLDDAANKAMSTFTQQVEQNDGLWFDGDDPTFEYVVATNSALNALGTAICVADPNPWVHWIGGIAGTGVEIALGLLIPWYKPDLIGANQVPYLAENLRAASAGEPRTGTGNSPRQVKLYGSSASDTIVELVGVAYSQYPDGDLREDWQFTGTDPHVNYTFTFRHFLGDGTGLPPVGLPNFTIETNYHMIYNPQSGKDHFSYAENILTWDADTTLELGYQIQCSKNGAPFYTVAVLHNLPSGTKTGRWVDISQQSGDDEFQYRVRAYNKGGFGPFTAVQNVSLPVPNPPYGLSASTTWLGASLVQNHVYWMVSSLGDVEYDLERAIGSADFVKVASVPALNPSTRGANWVDAIAGAQHGEQVRYRLKAWNDYGDSAYSEMLAVSTT